MYKMMRAMQNQMGAPGADLQHTMSHSFTTPPSRLSKATGGRGMPASHPLSSFKADTTPAAATPPALPSALTPARRYTDDTVIQSDMVTPGQPRLASSLNFDDAGDPNVKDFGISCRFKS